jgi:hypothetical protein
MRLVLPLHSVCLNQSWQPPLRLESERRTGIGFCIVYCWIGLVLLDWIGLDRIGSKQATRVAFLPHGM